LRNKCKPVDTCSFIFAGFVIKKKPMIENGKIGWKLARKRKKVYGQSMPRKSLGLKRIVNLKLRRLGR